MTIYFDNVGNKFLGDCVYANHNISYPNINFLQAHPHTSISAELTGLLTSSGLKFRDVLPQLDFDNTGTINKAICAFAPSSDTIDDRYALFVQHFFANIANGFFNRDVIMFNDSGYSSTNSVNMTNAVTGVYSSDVSGGLNNLTNSTLVGCAYDFETLDGTKSQVSWIGVADADSLALFSIQYNLATGNIIRSHFTYAGLLKDINTNNNYYNQNINTRSILLSSMKAQNTSPSSLPIVYAAHYTNGTPNKLCLTTGDAMYPIACADGQSPTAQWATDFYIFDNDATLGYPAIGRVGNLLLAQGNFTTGKPVKIQGAVLPDNGFNCWLPVGTFADKTVLMRCYSSVDL